MMHATGKPPGTGRGIERSSPPFRTKTGFTLIELIISMGLSAMLVTMVLNGLTTMNRTMSRIQQRTQVQEEARLLSDHFSETLRKAGGGVVRPWTALAVENDFDGQGSDRLTYARLESDPLQCRIEAFDGTTLQVEEDEVGVCCLTSAFLQRQVSLVSSDSDNRDHWEAHRVDELDLTTCEARLEPGQAHATDASPEDDAVWAGGVVAVVRVQVYWVDHTDSALKVEEDYARDGTLVIRTVADRVFDLQIALGYDVSPSDWQISETGDTQDEWLFNAEGDVLGGGGQGLLLARREDLRMVRFGLIVGAPVRGYRVSQSLQLLDGPVRQRDGWILGSSLTTVGLRNLEIMR